MADKLYRKLVVSGLLIIALAMLVSYFATVNFRHYNADLYWHELPLIFFYDGIFLGALVISVGVALWVLIAREVRASRIIR